MTQSPNDQVQQPAGMPTESLNAKRYGLKSTGKKNEGMIGLGWNIQDEESTRNVGRRTYSAKNHSSSDIIGKLHTYPDASAGQLQFPRKKLSDITEEMRNRIYGVPGQNIFTYGLEKPRPCRLIPENLDVGMIPKENCDMAKKPIHKTPPMEGSLEASLLPKEGQTIKSHPKRVSANINESHIKHGFVVADEPTKTTRLSPLKYATSLETGLLPAEDKRPAHRRHFSAMNAHCYDFLKGEQQ